MSEIVNIAGYKFVKLDQLQRRKAFLLELCKRLGLKGTILVSTEGINLFLAADRHSIDQFLATLRLEPEFRNFHVKESPGDRQPFNRLLVRIKQEIIAFGQAGIDPETRTSPKLKPHELKEMLDQGKPVTLLDVRNNYEIQLGTFENAVVADIDHFRQFPDAVAQLDQQKVLSREDPIVMFCTGGIRCEKAGPFMEKAGFKSVFQLDGGILQYFEDCGGQHYQGDCFVFDQRVAVDPDLQETDAEVCFACQAVLTPEMLNSDQYVPSVSCPICYRTDAEKQEIMKSMRASRIEQVCNPLPGSIPYDNYRPLNVPGRYDGFTLLQFLTDYHPHVGELVWRQKIESGLLLLNDRPLAVTDCVVQGQRIEHLIPANVEPDVNSQIELVYEDDYLVAFDKPSPLPVHPSGRFNRNTLTWILDQIYDHQLRVAHRLDANTTGLVLFSRTRKVAAVVQPQFEKHQVTKTYLAVVHGVPESERFQIDSPIANNPTLAGGRQVDSGGKFALTRFRLLAVSEDRKRSLVQAEPVTGRTNQIRIHLWDAGFPIVGDPTYLPARKMAEKQTLSIHDPPMQLHAWKLVLTHPVTSQPLVLETKRPDWSADFVFN